MKFRIIKQGNIYKAQRKSFFWWTTELDSSWNDLEFNTKDEAKEYIRDIKDEFCTKFEIVEKI